MHIDTPYAFFGMHKAMPKRKGFLSCVDRIYPVQYAQIAGSLNINRSKVSPNTCTNLLRRLENRSIRPPLLSSLHVRLPRSLVRIYIPQQLQTINCFL